MQKEEKYLADWSCLLIWMWDVDRRLVLRAVRRNRLIRRAIVVGVTPTRFFFLVLSALVPRIPSPLHNAKKVQMPYKQSAFGVIVLAAFKLDNRNARHQVRTTLLAPMDIAVGRSFLALRDYQMPRLHAVYILPDTGQIYYYIGRRERHSETHFQCSTLWITGQKRSYKNRQCGKFTKSF